MADQAVLSSRSDAGLQLVWQPAVLAVMAVPLAGLGLAFVPSLLGFAALAAALSIVVVAMATGLSELFTARRAKAQSLGAMQLSADDPAPCLCVNANGILTGQNAAAEKRFGAQIGMPVTEALSGFLVNAAAVVQRQEQTVSMHGQARETVFTRHGHVRLTTFRAGDSLIWRVDDAANDAASESRGIGLPMLVASQNGAILSSNDAMRALLGHRPQSMTAVFGEVPVRSGASVEIEGANGPVTALIMERRDEDGRREIFAFPAEGSSNEFRADPVFEALPVAALIIRPDGDVENHNGAARNLLGIGDSELSVKIGDLIEGPGRLAKDWMKDVLEERAHNRSEVVRMLRGKEDQSVKIAVMPIVTNSGPRLLAVIQDATEVQDLHTQFAQSQKMQAIGELAGGVAHDFNNLLTAITGHCDLLLLRHDQGDQDYADLVQIHQNANRAASLVGQLLAFSRKQTMKPELLDLRDTMADLTHLLNRLVGERVTLELSQDPSLQPIWADRRLLDQVLMNLVVNARDAMPEGGPIRITSRMAGLENGVQRNNVQVPPGNYVVIEVIDRGIGIPPDRLGRIFEPFYTTKDVGEGTGLGLSMAYGIMKQSGGYIFCDSTEGEGTTFSLIFPAHDWPAEGTVEEGVQTEAEAQAEDKRNESGVILLVEDEAPVRAFASRALRLKGFSVLEAENGEEALEVLEDDELEIDIFVTDMIMPGKGGPDWVREALVTRPDVGVVFTSGYAEDAYGKFPDIPQAIFLAKPFSLAELTETVQSKMH